MSSIVCLHKIYFIDVFLQLDGLEGEKNMKTSNAVESIWCLISYTEGNPYWELQNILHGEVTGITVETCDQMSHPYTV